MNMNKPQLPVLSHQRPYLRIARTFTAAAALAAAVAGGISISSAAPEADVVKDDVNAPAARVGLRIAPVPLNLRGRNPSLIGLGSYLVNATAGCNDCHSAGPLSQYVAGANPYF